MEITTKDKEILINRLANMYNVIKDINNMKKEDVLCALSASYSSLIHNIEKLN